MWINFSQSLFFIPSSFCFIARALVVFVIESDTTIILIYIFKAGCFLNPATKNHSKQTAATTICGVCFKYAWFLFSVVRR